jgi:hypothetical protein
MRRTKPPPLALRSYFYLHSGKKYDRNGPCGPV